MAPFDSGLPTKISPLIDGQVPDFIQADHPVFVEFLKQYYKFLESAEITIDGTVDDLLLETFTTSYVSLDGTNESGLDGGDRVVLETGSGTTGKFQIGETITGSTSKATATVLVDAEGKSASWTARLFISANQKFIEGETITGGTSGATSTILTYRANPVQNIQQLLEYQNTDNTVDHFLTAFRDSFLDSIPLTLADGVSKRKLIKSIRDLYAAKGTSEGHKLFFRILLGQEAEIDYPSKYMMRISDGNWTTPTIIRCTSDSTGAVPSEMAGQTITGASSGTKAQIIGVTTFNQGTDSIVEFSLRKDTIDGPGFSISETFTGQTTSSDIIQQFTVQGIVTDVTVNDGGILYSVGDAITFDTEKGNGQAEAKVSEISSGSISGVHIEERGENYSIGDSLKFTAASTDVSVDDARAFVSVVGGRLSLEDSTAITPTFFNVENETNSQFVNTKILLNGTSIADAAVEPYAVQGTDRRYSDSRLYYYPLYVTKARAEAANTSTGLAHAHVFEQYPDIVFYMPSNDQNHAKSTFDTSKYDLFVTRQKTVDDGSEILLEDNFKLLQEEELLALDAYGTDTDGIILESGTFTPGEATEINRLFLVNGGGGYKKLPTVTVTSSAGSGAEMVANTTTIGAIKEIEVVDNGFKYNADVPEASVNTNLILKDVDATFNFDSRLTSHTGNVVSYDNSVHKLVTSSTPTNRLTMEQSGTFNEAIRLENTAFAGIGESQHGPVNQNYSVQDESDDGVLIDNHSEKDIRITLENEPGSILTDAFEIDNYEQISLEQDLDSPVDIGIELEDSLVVKADVSGKILLDSHRRIKFARTEQINERVDLEDATVGNNVFGEQQSGGLLYNSSMDDVDGRFDLEADTPGREGRGFIQFETATESSSGLGREPRPIFDGTGFSEGDKVTYEIDTSIEFGNNTDSILLENSENPLFNSGSFLIQEDTGNSIVLNTSGGVDNELDIGDKLLQPVLDRSEASNPGQSIKHVNTPNSRLIGEGLDTFVTEDSDLNNLDPIRSREFRTNFILYNEAIFAGDEDGYGYISLDRTDTAGTDAGDRVLSEQAGFNILLDGNPSDPSFESGDILLTEDDTGGEQIILNATDNRARDDGDEIVMEDAFNVVGDSISDAAGGIATVLNQGTASVTANIGTTAPRLGNYINTDSLVSEDIIRIQDSYFYQAFSYEVKVGSILSDYINELKASVHPAGFIPFGKLSLSSQISVKIGTTGESTIDFTGDTDTFSPEFASLFGLVFGETLRMHHGEVREGVLSPDGSSSLFNSLVQENGTAIGDKLLEETDGDALLFESGFEIAVENSPQHSDGAILLDAGVGGSLLLETALGENPNQDRSVSHITKLSVRPEITAPKTAYGAPIASGVPAGSLFIAPGGIQLEDGLSDGLPAIEKDNLVLDGVDNNSTGGGDKILFEEDFNTVSGVKISDLDGLSISDLVELDTVGFVENAGLDSDGDKFILDGTSANSDNAGDNLLLDNGIGEADDGSNILLEGVGFRNFSDAPEGGIIFEQSSESEELVLEDFLQLLMEDGANIDLETGTDTGLLIGEAIGVGDNSVNIVIEHGLIAGEKLITEGSKIELEDNTFGGTIPPENFGNKGITQFTRQAVITTRDKTNRLALQDEFEINLGVALEDSSGNIRLDGTSAVLDIGGNVLLDGSDPGKSDEGDIVTLDGSVDAIGLEDGTGSGRIALNGTDASSSNAGEAVITEDGVIDVGDNVLLDSTGGRDLDDKLIMFDTVRNFVADNEGGFFTLDGTDGTGSNAGDELLLETNDDFGIGGTLEFINQNMINLANGLDAEGGGFILPVEEAQDPVVLVDGVAVAVVLITTFDSTDGTFDSTQTTFDAA